MNTNSEYYPWHKEYKVLGLPLSYEPYNNKPVHSILDEAASKYKNRGFIQNGKKITYPELKNSVDKLATALINLNLKKSDIVATVLTNSIEYVIADYAISKAGLVHLPCGELEPVDLIKEKFTLANPKTLIFLDSFKESALSIKNIFNMNFVIEVCDNSEKEHSPEKGVFIFTDLINNTNARNIDINIDVQIDLETLLFTGGTTGMVKGCMLTHRNIYANVVQTQGIYGKAPHTLMNGAISVLLGIPFAHSYGHIVMHSTTLAGFDVILIKDPRDIDYIAKMIKQYSPVLQFGVPVQFLKIVNRAVRTTGIIGISGSAALPESVRDEFENKGSALMEGYGLSEMGPVTHFNVSLIYRILGGRGFVYFINKLTLLPGFFKLLNKIFCYLGTKNFGFLFTLLMSLVIKLTRKSKKLVLYEKKKCIGIPLQDVKVKIIDVESNLEIPMEEVYNGKSGEMCLSGPQRMLGYWPTVGSGVDEKGFIRTGDVVKLDDKGYFYIIDRVKDMISVSGYKVYSREVEEILYKYNGVEAVAIVGIPDIEREGNEKVIAFIRAKDLFKDKLRQEDIIEFLKQKVAKYAVPKGVFFIDNMPLTKLQKVDKKTLRELGIKLYYKDFINNDSKAF